MIIIKIGKKSKLKYASNGYSQSLQRVGKHKNLNKRKMMNHKERKKLMDISKKKFKFDDFMDLHKLWCEYIRDLISAAKMYVIEFYY